MVAIEIAQGLVIGAIIGATLFRTFLPWMQKVIAEAQLAQRENRTAVVPRFDIIWGYVAGINVLTMGFILFASMDQFMKPVIDATSPVIGFFVAWAAVNLVLEGMFRMADSAIVKKDETSGDSTTPKPEPQPQ